MTNSKSGENKSKKERKRYIKRHSAHLTRTEKISYKIFSFVHLFSLWIVIPFILLIFIVDGFNIALLSFLGLIIIMYMPMANQYEKMLLVKLESRLKRAIERPNIKNDEGSHKIHESIENEKVLFEANSISLNTSARPMYLTISLVMLTVLFFWSHGWQSLITKILFYVTIVSVAFTVWFPYSSFVKRKVKMGEDSVWIGRKMIYVNEISHVVSRTSGTMIEFHLVHSKEAEQVRIENEEQIEARDFIKKWCAEREISFTEK